MKVYTKAGDDGTTGLLFGGRVAKDSPLPTAYGGVDEAQAALGLVRAELHMNPTPDEQSAELSAIVITVMRDLWVLMAELATLEENRHKLTAGATLVTEAMVTALESTIDDIAARFEPPTEFVVPGQNRVAALLDVARTVIRRAERDSVAAAAPSSLVVAYLNRLSDLVWTLARWHEGTSLTTRSL